MLGKTYKGQHCPIARALEIVGERWSLLILRDSLYWGARRFTEFQRSLGVASNILAARLEAFVQEGVLELDPSSHRADQREYSLTEKGRDFASVLMALQAWGERWATDDAPSVTLQHDGCGGQLELAVRCSHCGDLPEVPPFTASVAPPGPPARRRPRKASAARSS